MANELHQRAWDLLRQVRSELHDQDLISDDEYASLVTDAPDAPRRLESYDEQAKRLAKSQAEVERLRDALKRIVPLGGAAGTFAEQQLWTDEQREAWALERRAARGAR